MKVKQRLIIIHVDMDAFYAAVEVRDNPSLAGKPLIIGSLPSERGVVSTCSYEARKYGVHSAMNIKEAYRLCPHGIFMHPNFDKYTEASGRLHEIWNDYAVTLESIALDEAYLDVTYSAGSFEKAGEMARVIKERTRKELGLSCSVGIAYSKTAAKTASEEKKPDGYFEIRTPEDFVDLIKDRNVRALYTVGARTAEKLGRIGINKVRDINGRQDDVIRLLGKHGELIVQMAQGIDDRKVVRYDPQDAKSISRELTFQEDVNNYELLDDVLFLLALSVEERSKRHGLHGRGVTLKITYADMQSITRSKAVISADSAATIYQETSKLLKQIEKRPVRLIGAGIYNMTADEGRQMSIEDYLDETEAEKKEVIAIKLEEIGEKYKLDFAGNVEKIRHGEILHRTAEYMRKHS